MEAANARLDKNPANPIYQPAEGMTPDEVRALETANEAPIPEVIVTAPEWNFAEEIEYWRLRAPLYSMRPDGYLGGGMQDASEDEVTYLAQRNVAHDIRRNYRNFGDMQARADDLRLLRLFTPVNQLALGEGILSATTGLVGMSANGLMSMSFQDTGFGAYVQEQLTYSPRLQISQDAFAALAPVGEGFEYARSTLGDAGYSATGSPAVGAALTTLPDALAIALVPEARFATANVARGVGNGAIQGGKWLANGAAETLYRTSEWMLDATGQRMYVVPPSKVFDPDFVGPPTTRTLSGWLKDDPELLAQARRMYNDSPQWQGIDPDTTPVFYRNPQQVEAIRALPGESGGHHPHGLALGGPTGQRLTPTAETRTMKNPLHTEATNLQRQILRWIKGQ